MFFTINKLTISNPSFFQNAKMNEKKFKKKRFTP